MAIKSRSWGVVGGGVEAPGRTWLRHGAKGSRGDSGQEGGVLAYSREERAAELGYDGGTRNS